MIGFCPRCGEVNCTCKAAGTDPGMSPMELASYAAESRLATAVIRAREELAESQTIGDMEVILTRDAWDRITCWQQAFTDITAGGAA